MCQGRIAAEQQLIDEPVISINPSRQAQVPLAALLVCLNVVCNVASGEFIQFQETSGARPFDSPYFSIWFNHCITGIAAALILALRLWLQRRSLDQLLHASAYTRVALARDSILLAIVFEAFNICWAESVSKTTVSVFLAISQSACVPIFALSALFLSERVTAVKLIAIVICTAGVVVVSTQPPESDDGSGSPDTTAAVGVFWSLGYLGLYAAYMLLWDVTAGRRAVGDTLDVTLLVLGAMGVATITLLAAPLPLLVVQHGSDILPSGSQWLLVGTMAGLALLSNLTLMLALTTSSPSFVAVGSVLQIPLSAVADYVLHGEAMEPVACLAYLLIAIGFLLFTWQGRMEGLRADHDLDTHNVEAEEAGIDARPSA